MMNLREILRCSGMLTVIGGVVAAALAGTNLLTKDIIAERSEQIATEARQQVIRADSFTPATLTVDGEEILYYTAVKDGATVGYVFTVSTSGKSSGLEIMTGIDTAGKVTGVKITQNNETAGYADKVTNGGLLDRLVGLSADKELVLKRDVDGVSQATKTSGGVLKGVNAAITYFSHVKEGD